MCRWIAHPPGGRVELRCIGRQDAYTIVELVLVISIIAILGAVAGPRFFSNDAFDERAYLDELSSSLRYAQKVAVASGCHVRVSITASSYALAQQAPQSGHCDTTGSNFSLPVVLSTGQSMTGSAPSDVATSPTMTIVYDALGRTNLSGNQTLNVGSRALLIQAESGLVTTL